MFMVCKNCGRLIKQNIEDGLYAESLCQKCIDDDIIKKILKNHMIEYESEEYYM